MKKEKIRITIGAVGLLLFLVTMYFVENVYLGEPLPIDSYIQQVIFGLHCSIGTVFLKMVTFLSNPQFIVAMILLLLIIKKTRVKIGFPLAITEALAFATYQIIKRVICRARPDVSMHLINQGGFSFPSGHSVTSLVVYGLIIYFIRRYCKNRKLANVLTIVLGVIIIIIGISRIYLGVHWPTDVVGGWGLGSAFLMISISIMERKRKDKYENL